MADFEQVTNTIKEWFEGHPEVNEVTFGDANEVDLTTHTSFPLAHIIPTGITFNDATNTFSYQILLFGQPHDNTEEERILILNNIYEIANDFSKHLYSTKDYIRVSIGSLSGDTIYDERINRLYGWSLGTVSIVAPNTADCA
jgi:hypothetical protein